MLLEVLGSVDEDYGTIGRESEELEKSSLDEHPEGNTGRVGFALESNTGRVWLSSIYLLTSMNTTRVHLAYMDTGRVGLSGHF
mgnify:CR=1 FL=1